MPISYMAALRKTVIGLSVVCVISLAVGAIAMTSRDAQLPYEGEAVDFRLPPFSLENMDGKTTSHSQAIKDGAVILNIFASWCSYCAIEHPVWTELRNKMPQAQIIGVAWADKTDATEKWLKRHGDPYSVVLQDPDGELAVDLGVTGAPETYLIKDGRVVARFAGAMPKESIHDVFLPFLR